MTYLFILISSILLVSGQILWKTAVSNVGVWHARTMVNVVMSHYFILGAVLYVLATLVWLVVLSRLPLYIAYPFQSISYVIGMFASNLILNESISPIQWVGVFVIIIGVVLISQ